MGGRRDMVGEESVSGCWANSSLKMAREEGLQV